MSSQRFTPMSFFFKVDHPTQWDRIDVSVRASQEEESGFWSASAQIHAAQLKVRAAFKAGSVAGTMYGQAVLSFFEHSVESGYHPILPLKVRVLGPAYPIPSQVLLGWVSLGSKQTSSVELKWVKKLSQRPIVRSISSSDEKRLHVEVEEGDSATKLHVTFDGIPPVGNASGHIDVCLVGAHESVLRIPYRVSVVTGSTSASKADQR